MQWEYFRLSVDGPNVENALHELGLNGWELVTVMPETRIFFGYQCFLKRPVASTETSAVDHSAEKRTIERLTEAAPPRRLNNYIDVR